MHNFMRAVGTALRYRSLLAGILICSLAVGFLWGANLGAVYPFVEVILNEQSMHEWMDDAIEKSNTRIGSLREESRSIKAKPRSSDSQLAIQDERRLDACRAEIKTLTDRLAWQLWYRDNLVVFLPTKPFQTLVLIVCLLLIGTLLKVLFLMTNMILVERLAQRTVFDIRRGFYRHTLRMTMSDFGRDRTTSYLSKFTHDMQAVTAGLSVLFGKAIREPLKMVACLIGAALISWQLLLLCLIISPLAILVMNWLSRSIRRANRRAMEQMSRLYGQLTESLHGIQTVQAFTMERHERFRFHVRASQYMNRAVRIMTYNALTKPCTEMIGVGVIAMALLAGGYLAINDATHLFQIKISDEPLGPSRLMAFFVFLAGVSDPARKFAEIYNHLQRGVAASDRIYAMIDRQPSIKNPDRPQSLPDKVDDLNFDRVDFHYQPDQPVLRDVTVQIPRGQSVAIVGPNGCGKSTLINLIPRFFDPISGSVQLSGIDLRHLRLRDLRRRMGIVGQHTWLFDDTILNNLRYGTPRASEAEILEASKKAYAHQFIEKLPDGYGMRVGQEGRFLSGGQRQRIALARAILSDPEILILDEATSQIDLESEVLIHKALESVIPGRTVIMITHRVSTLSLAERIIVMESGRITDAGTHDELLGRCQFYQTLQKLAA